MQRSGWRELAAASANTQLTTAEARKLHEVVASLGLVTRVHAANNRELVRLISDLGVKPTQLTPLWRSRLDWVCGRSAQGDPISAIDDAVAASR